MFNNEDNMVMPVAPMNNYGSNGGSFFGNEGWWLIFLFLIWGNNGWGNGQNANFNTLYPWMNNADQISDGFRDQMINSTLGNIQTGINDLSANTNNAFYNMMSQFSNCCCENRLATADLKYTIATENCADRYEAANNTRDIIDNANRNNQAIIDKLCQLELDAKDNTISELRSQIDALNTNSAVNNAVARVLADNAAQTQILNPTPIPAFTVPAPYTCGCNNGCYA